MDLLIADMPVWANLDSGGRMIIMIAIGAIFIYIAWKDCRTMKITNRSLALLLVFILADTLLYGKGDMGGFDRLAGALCVSVPMFLLTLLVPGAFGGGDIKLMAVCGFWLGWKDCLTAMAAAVITGGIFAAGLLLTKARGRKSHMAFGPFLILGILAALFFGEAMRTGYWKLMGGFGLG